VSPDCSSLQLLQAWAVHWATAMAAGSQALRLA
jgi:hypothetical protein